MPIFKTAAEIEFLKRVDAGLRNCERQEDIAADLGLTSSGLMHSKLKLLGFKTSRAGGWHLVDLLMGRSLVDWLKDGEMAATPDAEPVGAAA